LEANAEPAAPVTESDAEAGASPRPEVHVSKTFLQNFAVRTVTAEQGSIPIEIRTVGNLRLNEKTIISVNTKYEGWIERASVNFVGEAVRKGQLLFEIYSPALVTTQKEYLASVEYLDQLSGGARPEAIERARALVEAAQERLRWWDVTEEQIAELAQRKEVIRTLKVFAPASGVVVERMGNALEGMRLTPGMTVAKIANLSTLWADVEIYEHQIQYLRLGQTVHISADAYPGRHWSGKVVFLDPSLNPQTRTLRASVEIGNRDGKLRPEMFVNVDIKRPASTGIVKVPEEVVLRTGTRSVVIVQKEPGVFEPREVHLGAAGGGFREVRHGLEAGETVVASSQFLIDSESSLREAIGKILARGGDEGAAATVTGHQH